MKKTRARAWHGKRGALPGTQHSFIPSPPSARRAARPSRRLAPPRFCCNSVAARRQHVRALAARGQGSSPAMADFRVGGPGEESPPSSLNAAAAAAASQVSHGRLRGGAWMDLWLFGGWHQQSVSASGELSASCGRCPAPIFKHIPILPIPRGPFLRPSAAARAMRRCDARASRSAPKPRRAPSS